MAAVRAAAEAAELSMNAVEAAVQQYVEARDYGRLKDMAEASAVAGQVGALSLRINQLCHRVSAAATPRMLRLEGDAPKVSACRRPGTRAHSLLVLISPGNV